jgi:radical SAM superfamily enzyme YgiQ (UPF0313 family)
LTSSGHEVRIFDTSFYAQYGTDLDAKSRKLGFYKEIKKEIPLEMKTTDPVLDLENIIREFVPALIGISALSIDFHLSKVLARLIKKISPEIPIILGGVHPTVSPDECIQEDCFDMICVGEGEKVLVELSKCIESKEDYSNINNLWVKNQGQIKKNPTGSFKTLDSLPVPDWDLFDPQHIWGPLYGQMYRVAPIELSRGCPYRCTYCVNDVLRNVYSESGKYHRRKAPEKAICDMLYLKNKYDIEMFYILDETFMAVAKSEIKTLAEMYKQKINIPFFAQTRPETVTEEKAKIVADMGCRVMSMGIENGNDHIRKAVLNRKVSKEQIISGFKILKKYGIQTSSFNMLGVPGETVDTILETIELNKLCEPDSIGVAYFFPYKGTALREFALKKNMITGDEDPNLSHDVPVLKLPTISQSEIVHYFVNFVELCR